MQLSALPTPAAPGVRTLVAWALRRLWHSSTITPAAVQTKVLRFIAFLGYRVQRHDDSPLLLDAAADNSFELCGRPFHSGLCDQPQSFSFGVVAHCAGRVKVHRCPLFRSVCGPMRQAVVIRIASSGKIHPGSTDLLR